MAARHFKASHSGESEPASDPGLLQGHQCSVIKIKPIKRLRILTIRDFKNEKSFEAIEWDKEHRQLFWFAEEPGAVACFPCDVEFAALKFTELGRIFEPTKLPGWPRLSWWRRVRSRLMLRKRKP